ncbi:MAG: lysophospholipid acyltransferase family protein [Bacteroidota bacterium]
MIRASIRFLLFVFVTSAYISRIIIKAWWKGEDLHHGLSIRQKWVQRMFPLLGIRMQVEGTPPKGPCLIIANHRSYFDPIAILRDTLALPVSKAEVRRWPIIGIGAQVTGTLFVQRANAAHRRKTQFQMAKTIKEKGYPVINFAEGTTHDHPTTGDFKSGAFIMAIREQMPVVPVAIEYRDPRNAWVGDDTFVPHFLRTFGERHVDIRIQYADPLYAEDYKQLREETKAWIDQKLLEFRADWG